MRAGETRKFSCDCRAKDFEITLEPNALDAQDAAIEVCPFCGSDIKEGE